MKSKWLEDIVEERGVAALEFAVVFPFFWIMILFMFEFAYQQVLMNLVERYAMQATVVARTAEDPSQVPTIIENLFKDNIPKWMYSGSESGEPDIVANYGDTLEEAMNSPTSGFGGKGQTVCLRISVRNGSLFGWDKLLSAFGAVPRNSREIFNCYVNWDVNW